MICRKFNPNGFPLKTGKLILLVERLILFVFLSGFFVFVSFSQSEDFNINQGDAPERLKSPNEVGNLAEWKRFNFSESNFSILFPNKPGQHENSKTLPQGFINQFRFYWDTSDEQLYFEAQVLEISSGNSYNLERGVQGFKRQMKARNAVLLNEKRLQVNNISAVDLSYRVPDEPEPILNYTRIMFCNNRIYTLMVAGTELQKDLFSTSTKYFGSFTPLVECEKQVTSTTQTNKSKIKSSASTPIRKYIRGSKGGCYYINSQGNNVYVERHLCR